MQFIRSIFRVGYKRLIKPLLFKKSPDDVHKGLIALAGRLQSIPGFTTLGHWMLAHTGDKRLRQEIAGVTFSNPVGISAGFDKNIQLPPTLKMIGCGFETGGSVTRQPRAGNPRPWYYRLPNTKSLVVHAGLANQGIDKITTNINMYKHLQTGMPLIISVAVVARDESCTTDQAIQDACDTLQIIQQKQLARMVEVNISCPNARDGQPFTQLDKLECLLVKLDALHLTMPVFIKMPNKSSWHEFEPILDMVAQHTIDGVTIANLVKDRDNVELNDELPETIKGGLSGKPTFDRSNVLIRETYKKYGDKLMIIGVGGIFSADDAYEKITSGASLVALITGMIFEGPQIIGDINHGLAAKLDKSGYAHIREAVGSGVK